MKKRTNRINVNKIKVNFLLPSFIFILFTIFIARIIYLCTVDYKVGNSTITAFIEKRNTKEETILPTRGSILDSHGNILAEDVASYNVIAYLSPKRSENFKTPQHVVDPAATAKILAPYIDMDEKLLTNILSKDAYQVELGKGSRNLSQIQMEQIKALNLPGIDFIASTKRYYPSGNFASYAIGYTVNKEDEEKNNWKVGQLGIEEYFNKELTGKSGYIKYEKDRYGYRIANGREYIEEAQNGQNIYLTIDSNIQLFTENAIDKMMKDSEGEWGVVVVADAKTGAILAYSTSPSFNPNQRDMTNYIDPLTGNTYEPGSTMKIFSYMCAIESGKYDGNETYQSGSITYEAKDGSKTVIHDWNKDGWGTISLDYGFAMSSNVGAASLLEKKIITKKELSTCYDSYGFGKKTNFTLLRESSGNISFNYDIDAASATFGQAITLTPIQLIQALTSISNDGKMIKPYIVSKMVNPNTNETTYENTVEVVDSIASSSTINKIKSLMSSVVCEDSSKCTGSAYYMKDYPIMGKTGTAQIYDEQTGTYMTGASDYIYSFAGLYPIDNPQIIVYTALKRPKDTTNYVAPTIKDVVVNTSKYLNIIDEDKEITSYKIDNYINKKTDTIKNELEQKDLKLYVLGNGEKIINQYPAKNSILQKDSTIVLLTDKYDKNMPNLVGLSYKDAINILKLMNVKYQTNGYGYVQNQNIGVGTIITDNDIVTIDLSDDYKKEN